jgi:tetratricopeptide (TPR) repeat protein
VRDIPRQRGRLPAAPPKPQRGHELPAGRRRSGARKLLHGVLLTALCAGLTLGGAHAEAPKGREVKDLHYGDVLFYFYQDKFFEAITRFDAAREMGFADAHADDGELLLGGMLLSYGMHDEAARIFQRLLDTTARPDVRNRAWYYLGRVSYERGEMNAALSALDRIKGPLPGRMQWERLLLRAQVLMALGRFDDAVTSLQPWNGPEDLGRYAYFNLGVALLRAGHTAEALRWLDQAGVQPSDSVELQALRDRANVALGFTEIQAKQPEAARQALLRVRLQGPYSTRALLGLGWADSDLGEDNAALVPWQALSTRDPLDPAVQEGALALPYAMARLHAYARAADSYQDAIKRFDDETQRLDASIATIRGTTTQPSHWVASLLAGDKLDRMSWDWHLDKLPDTIENRHLLALLASHRFQEALKNYRDLRFLRSNLDHWSHDVGVFSDMLDAQQQAFDKARPAVQQALHSVDLQMLQQRRAALAARVAQIEKDHDVVALADAGEQQQWAQMQSIAQRIDALGDTLGDREQAAGLRDRLRLLKGVLLWKLNHDFALRLWQQKHALAQVDTAIADAEASRQSVDKAQDAGLARIAGLRDRVARQPARIATLSAATDRLLARQETYLQDLAVDELERHKQRLHDYSMEARFALAQIYDRAATQADAPPPAPAAAPASAPAAGQPAAPAVTQPITQPAPHPAAAPAPVTP